jgi:DNA-binding response OmpR family regulator
MTHFNLGRIQVDRTCCDDQPDEMSGGSSAPADSAGRRQEGRPRVLIAEDSYLIAILLEQILEEQGWEVIGPVARVPAALTLARSERIDAALLDINLCGEMCWEVATALQERGIPFAFSTGYGRTVPIPEHLADAFVLEKPFRVLEVERRVRAMLRGRVCP